MQKRIAFGFDEDSISSLKNMLDEQFDDYVTVKIKHPIHGDEQEILLPNIQIGQTRIITEQAYYQMQLHSDIIKIERKLHGCKEIVDEMLRLDDYSFIHQLEGDMQEILGDFKKFSDPDYGEQ